MRSGRDSKNIHTYKNTEHKTCNKETNDQLRIISCENPFEEIIG